MTCYKMRKDPNRKPTRKELDETVRMWQERKKRRKWKMEDLLGKGKRDKSIEDSQK